MGGEQTAQSASTSTGTVSVSTLNFGWHQLHAAARARLARDVASAGKPARVKRAYDNSKRAAGAAYKRVQKRGKFLRNGASQARVRDILSKDRCSCYLMIGYCNYGLVLHFSFL